MYSYSTEHWKLTWREPSALYKLVLSMLGFCLHSGTDNVAYDVTVRSQLAWAKELRTLPSTFYISVAGRLPQHKQSWLRSIKNWIVRSACPRWLYGIDTSRWLESGSDGLLSVYTQEYPRLGTMLPQCSACATTIVAKNAKRRKNLSGRRPPPMACNYGWPTHESIRLDETALTQGGTELRRGVWYTVHREMSHLTAALACGETWTLLMRAVQVIVNNHERNPLHSSKNIAVPTAACRAPPVHCACFPGVLDVSPDRQAPHIGPAVTAADHSSLGMDYRWGNLTTAAVLLGLLLYTQWDESWDGLQYTLAGLFLLLMGTAVCRLLRCHQYSMEESAPDLPNYNHYYADALSMAFAALRVLLTATDSSSSTDSVLGSRLFLWETVLQHLLPRPLLDYGLPLYATVLAILLDTQPHVWGRLNTWTIQVILLVLTALPKVTWAAIYLAEKLEQRWENSATTIGRDLLVWAATAACVACWTYHVNTVYHVWKAPAVGGQWGTAEVATLGLFALSPLRWFQDQSECFQYVTILRHYSPLTPPVRSKKKRSQTWA